MSINAPCSWPVSFLGCAPDAKWTALSDAQRAPHIAAATEFLWRWTGRVLGLCPVTIRPCRTDHSMDGPTTFEGRGPTRGGGTPWRPVLVAGKWYNIGCGSCGFDGCDCDGPATIALPGPVDSITQVKIDGVVLPATSYRVDSRRWLVRTDGGSWPTAQDTLAADTMPGTWSVTYLRGVPVPSGGQIAAGVLALELWRAACNDGACGLPKRFQSITRQGVTVAMLDSFDDIDKGHTGIFIIDSWVTSMVKVPNRSSVYSPDVRPHSGGRQTTWVAP